MAGNFSTPPVILTRIIEMTDDPRTPVEKVAEVLAAEPAVAARVLKLSNSAFFGRSREIASLREAVVMLGFSTIRSLVVATAAHGLYFHSEKARNVRYQLWDHSLATAVCCRLLAYRSRQVSPEESYISGLLHDIGKLVLLERWPDQYVHLLQTAKKEQTGTMDMENRTFGFSHALLGAALMDCWLFPERLSQAIALHHEKGGMDILTQTVSLANQLVTLWGHNLYPLPEETAQSLMEDEVQEIRDTFETSFNEQKALFDA